MENKVTENEGVVAPKGSDTLKKIVNDIEAGKLREGYEIVQTDVKTFLFDDLNDALEAYKADKLPVLGMGKNRGYELSGSLGVAGLLGLMAGGILLAKGKTALGAVGLGAGAGLEVGAYATLPKKVPIVLYYYVVREDVVGHTISTRYVVVKLPKQLSDTAFEARSKAQIRQRINEGAFVVPSPIEVERAAARDEQKKEVESNGNPHMPLPDVASSSSSSSSSPASDPEAEPQQEDVEAEKERQEAEAKKERQKAEDASKGSGAPAAPAKKAVTPSVVESRSSKDKAAASNGSGIVVLPN